MNSAFTKQSGRIAIHLSLMRVGADILACCLGGTAHIGAVATAHGETVDVHCVPKHREEQIAADLARQISNLVSCTCTVVCGIHYDNITKDEIQVVEDLVAALITDLKADLALQK